MDGPVIENYEKIIDFIFNGLLFFPRVCTVKAGIFYSALRRAHARPIC